ncbi:MAG: DMT family transporter [Candidatus Altiarchaeota archaeon]
MNKKTKGILFVFLASLMWAFQAILTELSYKENASFLSTTFIAFVFIFLTSFIYSLLKRKNFYITKTNAKAIFYISITGAVLADLLYNFALFITHPLNVVLIGHTQPVFIILMSYIFLKEEKMSFFDYIGGALMLLSAFLVSSKTIENLMNMKFGTLGEVAVLIATILWASDSIVAKRYLQNLDSSIIVFYRYLIAMVIFLAYMLPFSYLRIDSIYQPIIGISVAIGAILFYEGLKILKAAQVGFIELCAPFSTAILAWIFLNEKITELQILGLIFLAVGVYFISKSERVAKE